MRQNNQKKNLQKNVASKVNLSLERIKPLTENQAVMFNSDKHLVAHGWAGTGKTFCASYLALHEVMVTGEKKRLIYIRSAVETRKIGFLPGNEEEKTAVYEGPFKEICHKLFDRADAYDYLKQKAYIQYMTTSFIRGMNLKDAVIVVDEYQNMSLHELDSVITRLEGDNNRIIFCGDTMQSDIPRESGIHDFNKILKRMGEFDFIDFGLDDIVRGPLVKSYLQAKYANG